MVVVILVVGVDDTLTVVPVPEVVLIETVVVVVLAVVIDVVAEITKLQPFIYNNSKMAF